MLLSCRGLFGGILEGVQRPGPHLVKVSAQPRHAFGIELIEPAGSVACVPYETGVFEYLEVLRNSGTAYRQGARQFVDGNGAIGKALKDSHAGSIAERIESGL
jgi:hypothetical protein